MPDWQRALRAQKPGDEPSGAEQAEPRIRDADGKQLAQIRNAMHDELECLEESAAKPSADLSLETAEHLRTRRALARRKNRKP